MLNYTSWEGLARSLGADTRFDLTQLATQLKALSHPKRLSIFNMLMEGVQCNCELHSQLGLSLSLISHHMRILEDAGLVASQRDLEDARWIYYAIDQAALTELVSVLDRFLDVSRIQPRSPSCGPKGCTDASGPCRP
jgi:ArsR family transcriptional regulator